MSATGHQRRRRALKAAEADRIVMEEVAIEDALAEDIDFEPSEEDILETMKKAELIAYAYETFNVKISETKTKGAIIDQIFELATDEVNTNE